VNELLLLDQFILDHPHDHQLGVRERVAVEVLPAMR
jgi:hypothetical protein